MAANVNKPLIAVTGPVKRFPFGWWATKLQLARVGLKAIYVNADAPELPDNVAGIVIGGGDDIDPKHYGVTGTGGANYDEARDALEIDAIKYGLERQLPMLGICRGSQLINVVLGGNLHSDLRPLRKNTPNRNSLFPIKYADLFEGSKLKAIFDNASSIKVNSLHSQAVDNLGDGLMVSATDRDGFIQGIEAPNRPFLLGVQWHPEYLLLAKAQTKLFKTFAKQVHHQLKHDVSQSAK